MTPPSNGAPSPFDAFNARYLDAHEVAQTFVPPLQFEELIKRRHTVLIGPRGAGKTTLLKMLQGPALAAWAGVDADRLRRLVDFTGVFIPADRLWASAIENVGERLGPDWQAVFATAGFTTHLLLALVDAMAYRVRGADDRRHTEETHQDFRATPLDGADERSLANEIASVWGIDQTVGTLRALGHQLEGRNEWLHELAASESMLGQKGRADRLGKQRALFIGWETAALAAISRFNDAVSEPGGRWALMFDELELVPSIIRSQLMSSLRSTDARLVFKLSLAPYTEGGGSMFEAPAMAGHDYQPLILTHPKKEQAYPFCRDLLSAMLKDRGLPDESAESLLGHSLFETEPGEWKEHGTAYHSDSRVVARMRDLSKRDPSFAQYLEDHKVDLEDLANVDGKKRPRTLRKTRQMAEVRAVYMKAGRKPGTQQRASLNRAPDLYAGATNLFAMVEGNPRWFIGVMTRLLTQIENGQIKPAAQAREIEAATILFRALLRGRPATDHPKPEVLEVLDRIGAYLADRVQRDRFDPEPPGSFRVDMGADEGTLEALKTAVNAGAVIYVPGRADGALLDTLVGRRFRLAYLLAPYYGLPLLLGRPVSLASIRGDPPTLDEFDDQPDDDEDFDITLLPPREMESSE